MNVAVRRARPAPEFPPVPEMAGTPIPTRIMHPDSCWYRRTDIPNLPAHPNSAQWISNLASQMYPGNPNIAGSSPVYVVPANYPTVPVAVRGIINGTDTSEGKRQLHAAFQRGVPVPEGFVTGASPIDAPLNIWQPSTQTWWDLYSVQLVDGVGVTVSYGAAVYRVNEFDGVLRDRKLVDEYAWQNQYWSASAISSPSLCGMVSIEEWKADDIQTALRMALGHAARSPMYLYPANRCDGDRDNTFIPEGARVHVPWSQIAADKIASIDSGFLPMYRAITRYGIFATDKTANSISVAIRDYRGTAGGRSWSEAFTLPSGKGSWDVVRAINWSDGVVVDPDFNR